MIIERKKNEVILKFESNFNILELQDIIDIFKFKDITKKSSAAQKDIDELVKAVKKGRWERTKKQIGL